VSEIGDLNRLAGLDYRVAFSHFSEDGKRAVDVCESKNGESYLDEMEWVGETTFENRHSGKLAGPFKSPEDAETFVVTKRGFVDRSFRENTSETRY